MTAKQAYALATACFNDHNEDSVLRDSMHAAAQAATDADAAELWALDNEATAADHSQNKHGRPGPYGR
jgi:hypothetical protein